MKRVTCESLYHLKKKEMKMKNMHIILAKGFEPPKVINKLEFLLKGNRDRSPFFLNFTVVKKIYMLITKCSFLYSLSNSV